MFEKTDFRRILAARGSTGAANPKPFESTAPGRLAGARVWVRALLAAALLTSSALVQSAAGQIFTKKVLGPGPSTGTMVAYGTKAAPALMIANLGVMTQTTSTYLFNALNLAPGTHAISARYSGNAKSAGSASNTLTVVVN